MKKTKDYFPTEDAKIAIWGDNFGEGIAAVGPLVGLTPPEITELQDAALDMSAAVRGSEMKRTQAAEASTYKKRVIREKGVILRKAIARIKTHPAFTENIGRDLDIISLSQLLDISKLRPEIKLTAYPGYISIAFNKQGAPGVSIFCRIKGTHGWEKLANDFESPYLDKRPLAVANQPEIREYMAMYTNLRENIGQQSDIATIVFGG